MSGSKAGDSGRDPRAGEIISFLRSHGAERLGHAGGRTLLDHLVGTYEIVRRWEQPLVFQHAALVHSVYGTDVYARRLLPLSRREDVVRVAGDQAERLAYLFCATPRDLLFAGTHVWARDLPGVSDRDAHDQPAATRAELDALVLLHMANRAEQARAEDGSPAPWLTDVRELAELLIGSDAVTLPLFVAELAAFSEDDEALTRRAYRDGMARADDPGAMANLMALAAAACPVVPEPCIWQAYLSRCRGGMSMARWWARCARRRLLTLGTAWDKRLSFDEWLELAGVLAQPPDRRSPESAGASASPRALYETVARGHVDAVSGRDSSRSTTQPTALPDAAAGRRRFHRYVDTFAHGDDLPLRGVYPQLDGQPWYDPSEFPLVSYLESHYDAIRDEILGLGSLPFHRESERIKRSGEWDVAFLYERGRRRDAMCDACPVTTRGIESYPAMRTVAGLIYASRMRGGTHIEAHRGPTNLRVRCHLGIQVPEGDCGIRVADETRQWREGRCLVFDDHFEHEAWNHTDEDRIVLIVDMWHPGLSPTEVRLLEGLHRYAYAYARQLSKYWSSNAAAAGGRGGGKPRPQALG